MTHAHTHGRASRTPPLVQRRLALALAPFAIATIAGLILLWPKGDVPAARLQGVAPEQHRATVVSIREGACETPPGVEDFVCSVVEVTIDSGPDAGERFSFEASGTRAGRGFEPGDPILVARAAGDGTEPSYSFVDFQRRTPLAVLGAAFVVVVIALSRWRGFTSLIGLALSLLLLIVFVIPAILEGSSPLAVAVVGSAAIMFATLYLAHGVNARTTTAVLGTLASLAITGVLAVAFVELARFTGFGSEEAAFLQVSAQQVNLEGLLLGGVIIGTLGVLDDVTVTQASAVWELHRANPDYGVRDLYLSALRIGRDHIAATVNTLVLAYAGASLPLLILFTLSARGIGDILVSEVVAEEIVRTLVGSIGLVASVPLTTALTAAVVSGGRAGPKREPSGRTRFEREWFG